MEEEAEKKRRRKKRKNGEGEEKRRDKRKQRRNSKGVKERERDEEAGEAEEAEEEERKGRCSGQVESLIIHVSEMGGARVGKGCRWAPCPAPLSRPTCSVVLGVGFVGLRGVRVCVYT